MPCAIATTTPARSAVCAAASQVTLPALAFPGASPLECFSITLTFRRLTSLHLIDPFEGVTLDGSKIAPNYNRDPDYVLRQYPPGARVVIHRERIPCSLPGKFAFIYSDTGAPAADAQMLPAFYESLNPGGVFLTDQYANNRSYYEPVLEGLGIAALWLPSGQGVIIKPVQQPI